jgi:hypothetical protein
MKLRLGINLDGQRGRSPVNQLGCTDVGPLGLIGILETQLGLVPPAENTAQRCVQFRECLQKTDGPDRFFHKSFEADDFGTAATLLDWRDTWRMHGWSGQVTSEANTRLKDMEAIEKLAIEHLSLGTAERLQRILSALDTHSLMIESIVLIDPLDSFPALWQKLLHRLPIHQVAPNLELGRGLLGQLQQALLDSETAGERTPLTWVDDDSIEVMRGETALTNARWIAETLRSTGQDTLYVATSEAAITDAFLVAANSPRQGLSDTSSFRPALQLLPLVLELLWSPLNFHALIQFLTHPICPLRRSVRSELADLQSQYPGVGGPRWHQLIQELQDQGGDHGAQIKSDIEFWIDHPRYSVQAGAPVAEVLKRVQRLAKFFNSRTETQLAYSAGYQQCFSFAESLARLLDQGVETLSQRQLEQLAALATARGKDNPLGFAQVGAQACITHPGAVVGQHSVVVWGPLEATILPKSWPWSSAEIEALRASGCVLPTAESLLQKAASEWLRPILAAKDKLILVLPPAAQEFHPIWQMINALIDKLPVTAIENFLNLEAENRKPLVHKPLPGIKRWWHLPQDTAIPKVEKYSFTQLEKQLFNPTHWLLNYPAKLRAASLLSLADDFRLKGLIAHSLVERLYRDANGLEISDANFDIWFDTAFDQLIAEEGAIYLMPGRRTDRENLRRTLQRSLRELRVILKASNVSQVEPERYMEGTFIGGTLTGHSDLVLTGPTTQQAIIDMKWAGEKTHKPKLEKNRHLQLAVYAVLLRQSTGAWPALGYYLVSQRKLLTRDSQWFTGTVPVQNQTDENTAQLWQRFLVTWKWRQDQFAKGDFEVVFDESSDPQSLPPEDGLATEVLIKNYNDYRHLMGWGERA